MLSKKLVVVVQTAGIKAQEIFDGSCKADHGLQTGLFIKDKDDNTIALFRDYVYWRYIE